MRTPVPALPTPRLSPHRWLASAIFLTCASTAQMASAQAVLDYAGRWTFDDCGASGSILKDSSGNNATATRGGSVFCSTDSEGRASGAVNLLISQPGNGTAATTVAISNTNAFRLSDQMSVSAKIKPGATPGGAILTKGWTSSTGVAQKTFQLAIVKSSTGVNQLKLTIWMTAPGSTLSIPLSLQSSAGIAPSVWTQVGASYDRKNGIQLFINGKVVAKSPALDAVIRDAPIGTNSTMWMGGGAPQQTFGYTGAIDDVWISKGSCADLRADRDVVPEKELMITHLGVVDDPVRTAGLGAWTFGRLASQMVPANDSNPQAALDAASVMVENMFKSFGDPQVINKQTIAARTIVPVKQAVFDHWPRVNGKLDLSKAPLRLLAIVNRLDLRDVSRGDAGEGRFVFGVLDKDKQAKQFTIIFEYRLPAQTEADARIWARDWHALGNMTPGTSQYNTALQAITDRFTIRGAAPKRFNGNAISQVRTNELAMGIHWELREFALGAGADGKTALIPSPVAMTPGDEFKTTLNGFLGTFIKENADAILDGTSTVPLAPMIGGVQVRYFQGGSALVRLDDPVWGSPGIVEPTSLLRHTFAVNTCNGCHSAKETKTDFTHVSPRESNTESKLSGFLTGVTLPFLVDGEEVTLNDLDRRKRDMEVKLLTCPAPASTSLASTTTGARTFSTGSMSTTSTTSTFSTPTTSVGKGINRTH